MKQTLRFNLMQQAMVIEAMEAYQGRYKGGQKDRFSQVLERVENNATTFDSEEMIYITQALRAYGRLQKLLRHTNWFSFEKLANNVEKLRKNFQHKNNPLIRMGLA
ncbi:hypothetical protein M3689_00915 [Alkalihalophilus marmarensis]|uniref:hypothetical protein n=1 Tax=Alkalihalophilus marmarensis TaxID=521377 RepID=UPI00203BB773|nr:hypothetical protein [Alkalihalophilus marmarensis]MCM3487860.1 hypothetical protein [Alkalihalophilus marmarensis]